MKLLLSLPEKAAKYSKHLVNEEYKHFACSDPVERKIGSGGGTSWIIYQDWLSSYKDSNFSEYLSCEKKIIVHGGGQSRRLPAYAAMGKSFLPCPVFRWERAQRFNQTLINLQYPLLNNLISVSSATSNTIIASGDALIWSEQYFDKIPDADIVCVGMNIDPSIAVNHGVFVCKRDSPDKLEYMLQKPDHENLKNLIIDNLFYIDTGIWILSDNAIQVLMDKSGFDLDSEKFKNDIPEFYDLYGTLGLSLGHNPKIKDPEINKLTTAVLTIKDGRFFHFGTNKEIIKSSLELQNITNNQQEIWSRNIKPHPSIFTQNSIIKTGLNSENQNIWIENSFINEKIVLTKNNIITGLPENNFGIKLEQGFCFDLIPIKEDRYCLRAYFIDDLFKGSIYSESTKFLSDSFIHWCKVREIDLDSFEGNPNSDIYDTKIFPIFSLKDIDNRFIDWFLYGTPDTECLNKWNKAEKLSSADILNKADIEKINKQRNEYMILNIAAVRKNFDKSVFFQIDLRNTSKYILENSNNIDGLSPVKSEVPEILMQEMMFQSMISKNDSAGSEYNQKAFSTLQNAILKSIISVKQNPVLNVYEDQIVWGRSPVRIDLAGGWTDTSPYCILNGGSVVNISLELNGQPPLQAFIRPSEQKEIILRSIDLGAREIISNFDEIRQYNTVGSPFSIPKAALALCGFLPEFSEREYKTLKNQIDDFGSGLEISFLAAIPKGSGMGTSSILASTILGALSDFCGLGWDSVEICNRTLGLEQLLTTGGGWQDQYGGVVPGVKLLDTERGWSQTPDIRWLPDFLFTKPEFKNCMLLYYTGITRVAKNILTEIVEGMFLNDNKTYRILKEMKQHALGTYEIIQKGDFYIYGKKIARSWNLNKEIDKDTNNKAIQGIIDLIDDLSLGYKLPGAGGGGFLYIVAKDPDAAVKIKTILTANPPNKRARFVDMDLSDKGLQISRS